jgi:hypothetical protein
MIIYADALIGVAALLRSCDDLNSIYALAGAIEQAGIALASQILWFAALEATIRLAAAAGRGLLAMLLSERMGTFIRGNSGNTT